MRLIYTILLSAALGSSIFAQTSDYFLLVGTYTKGKSEGIYVYRFNADNGSVSYASKATGVPNPSYLAISKDQHFVYAVNETNGTNPGAVSAFSFDPAKGNLKFLNSQYSGGDDACYVSVDGAGQNVVVANYSGGNLSALKTNSDGSLQPLAQLRSHEGSGPNKGRQEKAHVHSAIFSPDEKYVFSADLGLDRLYVYNFNPSAPTNILSDHQPPYYTLPAGSGPRHFVFSPDNKYLYLLNELLGTIQTYAYQDGQLKEIDSVISDATTGPGDRGSADIHITPDGRFLYASNRATANNISIFQIGSDGRLTLLGRQAVGLHPRNFVIDPGGKFLLVANRDSNNVMIFSIKSDGLLQDTGVKMDVDMPVCLKLVPVK